MKHPVIAEVSIVPLGTDSTSLSRYVADVEKVLRESTQVKSMLTPMASILEGDLDDVLGVIRRMHEVPFLKGAQRVSTRITIDDRRDKTASMGAKVASVENKIKDDAEGS